MNNTLDPQYKYDADELTRLAVARTTTRSLFRLPITARQAYDILWAFYKAEVQARNVSFVGDQFTHDNIKKLAIHLTDAHSNKFGVMFNGLFGNGKTTLLHALDGAISYLSDAGVIDSSFFFDRTPGLEIHNARDIAYCAKNNYEAFKQIRSRRLIAIDDMGTEPAEISDYGNIRNPLLELLEYRYDKQLATIITTNLTPPKITEVYSERLGDRLREMMEVIVFENSTSYRR